MARIVDGDTIEVLVNQKPVKVRLEGIDAPETGQAFATEAKKAAASLCFGKAVVIHSTGRDRYGRLLGFVHIDDKTVNEELLAAGLAWHFKEYNQDDRLAATERKARDYGLGLWSVSRRVAPWDWRDWDRTKRQNWQLRRGEFASAKPRPPARSPMPLVSRPVVPTYYHWLNTQTGVRHNRGCRWYGKTESGRPCGATTGSARGICGG